MTDRRASGELSPSLAPHDEPDRSMDVMVVEDDPGVREATCEVLREEGYAVVSADSPPEALECLSRFPELQTVLVDIHLGLGISGIALAGRIRRTHPRCRILLTSGGEPPEGIAFDGFLAKPFSTRRLLAALRPPNGSAAGANGAHVGRSGGTLRLGRNTDEPLRASVSWGGVSGAATPKQQEYRAPG